MKLRFSYIVVFITCLLSGFASMYAQTVDKTVVEKANQNLELSLQAKEFDNARDYALESLNLSEQIYGNDSKESFVTTLILANIYSFLGDSANAGEMYLKSFALAARHFGVQSSEMDTVSANFGQHLTFTNSKDEASFFERYRLQRTDLFGYAFGGKKKLAKPKWPEKAKQTFSGGKITVKIWIDESGKVTHAKALLGDMLFAESAEIAAKKSTFHPTLKDGNPIPVTNFLTIKYSIP